MTDYMKIATEALNRWYYSEIRSLMDSAIEACQGRLITLEIAVKRGDFADVPRSALASAKASYVEYRDRKTSERSDGTDPREFMEQWVDQTTDGHEFVIYTYQAQLVLATSSNSEAWRDLDSSNRPDDSACACLAMRADVWEKLEAWSEGWEAEDPEDDPDDSETHDSEICPCEVCRGKRADKLDLDRNGIAHHAKRLANNRARVGGLAAISLACEVDQIEIRGNCSAIDPATDKETEEWIRSELNRGNDWAWCHVNVIATHDGYVGVDSLGCCSYKSEKDFRNGPYYTDMVNQALTELAIKLTDAGVTL